jgi:hypothetical protein
MVMNAIMGGAIEPTGEAGQGSEAKSVVMTVSIKGVDHETGNKAREMSWNMSLINKHVYVRCTMSPEIFKRSTRV